MLVLEPSFRHICAYTSSLSVAASYRAREEAGAACCDDWDKADGGFRLFLAWLLQTSWITHSICQSRTQHHAGYLRRPRVHRRHEHAVLSSTLVASPPARRA